MISQTQQGFQSHRELVRQAEKGCVWIAANIRFLSSLVRLTKFQVHE